MQLGNLNFDIGWTLGIAAFSIFMIAGSIFLAFRVVVRIPADYFKNPIAPTTGNAPSTKSLLSKIAGNVLGIILVLAGIAMLVLPGQGVLTILAGLLLIDFPGKYKLARKLASIPPVLRVINAIRSKAALEALRFSPQDD